MRATMADIARETGLTLGTVSRALNTEGKYAIAPETRERVMETATRLGYRPNRIGRALASGNSSLILLVSAAPFAPYYVEISRFLSDHAAQQGYSFVSGGALAEPGNSSLPPHDWLFAVDGIVVSDDYLPYHEAHMLEAIRLKIPIVAMGIRYRFPSDFVEVDLETSSRQLVRHLIDQGSRRPALMVSPGTSPQDPRVRSYHAVLEETGFKPLVLISQDQSRTSGRKAAIEACANGLPFDSLFCENDVMAVGAYRGLTDLGIRVPDDVLLAGCDGLDDALYQHTPITTIVQPLAQMCDLTWSMLRERMDGLEEPPRTVQIAARLEIRASTLR